MPTTDNTLTTSCPPFKRYTDLGANRRGVVEKINYGLWNDDGAEYYGTDFFVRGEVAFIEGKIDWLKDGQFVELKDEAVNCVDIRYIYTPAFPLEDLKKWLTEQRDKKQAGFDMFCKDVDSIGATQEVSYAIAYDHVLLRIAELEKKHLPDQDVRVEK